MRVPVSRKRRILRKASLWLLFVAFPVGCWIGLFWAETGEFPSVSAGMRRLQVVRSCFPDRQRVVMRDAKIGLGGGSTCWVAFQKDEFLEDLFGLGVMEHPRKTFFELGDKPIVNKVMLFEEIDLGIVTPVLSYVWPLHKVLELELPLENVRLLDVSCIDLDADGSCELVIYWSDYCGGSGGMVYPLIVRMGQGGKFAYETFPSVEVDGQTGLPTLLPPGRFTIRENGFEKTVRIGEFHTDVFFGFEDFDHDGMIELVTAVPQGDWDYHFGPQGWLIGIFEFRAGRLVPDPDGGPIIVPKAKGLGLPEIHGYSSVPTYGQLFFLWCPSWLDIGSPLAAYQKGRARSRAFTCLQERGRFRPPPKSSSTSRPNPRPPGRAIMACCAPATARDDSTRRAEVWTCLARPPGR